jgi:hypothetical protein
MKTQPAIRRDSRLNRCRARGEVYFEFSLLCRACGGVAFTRISHLHFRTKRRTQDNAMLFYGFEGRGEDESCWFKITFKAKSPVCGAKDP